MCIRDSQKLQIEDRGEVSFAVQGEVRDQEVAPLLFIVFVENSFKHSTSSQSKDIIIDIQITVEDDHVKMRCHNTHLPEHNDTGLSQGVGL